MKIGFTILLFIMVASCSSVVPVAITDNPFGGKVGKSCQWMGPIVSLFSKDMSIESAKQSAGITKPSSVELKRIEYPLVFFSFEYACVIVSGS